MKKIQIFIVILIGGLLLGSCLQEKDFTPDLKQHYSEFTSNCIYFSQISGIMSVSIYDKGPSSNDLAIWYGRKIFDRFRIGKVRSNHIAIYNTNGMLVENDFDQLLQSYIFMKKFSIREMHLNDENSCRRVEIEDILSGLLYVLDGSCLPKEDYEYLKIENLTNNWYSYYRDWN